MKLQEGDNAPNFALKGSDDKDYTLDSFAGKRLVLYFYPKDDTPGCTKEATDFTDLHKEFAKLDVVVVGVSPDTVETHQQFIKKYKLGILLLADPERSCIDSYGAWGEKKNYGKVYEGLIRSTMLISPKGKIERVYYNVKATGHAERVLRELKETF